MFRSALTRSCGVAQRSVTAPIKGSLSLLARRAQHTLPDLPYDYNGLEPVISAEIMRLHHSKHHKAYVDNLNIAEEKLQSSLSHKDVSNYIQLGSSIKFNGGGHINHSIFWKNLKPIKEGGGGQPTGGLLEEIRNEFESFEKFIQRFNSTTAAIQGSGWGWLGYNKNTKRLEIATTSNQDPLLATTGLVPLLGVDVWEHAYYLDYKNARAEYLKKIWDVVNWGDVTERYRDARH